MTIIFRDKRITGGDAERDVLFEDFARDMETGQYRNEFQDLLLLALVEAVNNAVEHGNGNDPRKQVHIRYLVRPELVLASVGDQGAGFEPRFPDLRRVTGARGRGLGLIRANVDHVFFNLSGNHIFFCKGDQSMTEHLVQEQWRISTYPNGVVLVTDLDFGPAKLSIVKGIAEILDKVGAVPDRTVFLDLKGVRILSSLTWGSIFAEVQKDAVRQVILFNAGEAILQTANQMGLTTREEETYKKIVLLPDASQAMHLLAEKLTE
ncbi:ATP-binding protein [Desulfonatronum lacustre]|uniref:ATP-binding protein n=1 Tax=Desulfonatronum lacustre TaxID=66849 RepID=UPI0004B41672|nr:ATP-binding protein [Desulfonatronum lacustre]